MKLNVYVCEGWRWMKHCCTSALCLCPGCRDGLGAAVSKSSGQCGQSWVMLSWQGTESAGHPHGPLLLQALQVGSQGHPSWGHTLLSPLSAFTTEPFFHQLSSPILYFLFFWENRAQFNKKSRLFWYTWALMIDSQTFLIIQLQDRPSVFKINLKMPQRRKLSLKIFLFDAGGWDSRWKQLNVPRRGSSSSGHCLPPAKCQGTELMEQPATANSSAAGREQKHGNRSEGRPCPEHSFVRSESIMLHLNLTLPQQIPPKRG